MSAEVRILYRNYAGLIAVRRIYPIGWSYASNKWHPVQQWLLFARDLDKDEDRTFAQQDIIAWGDARVNAILALQHLSDGAPPSPWRTVESTQFPGNLHIAGPEDRTIIGNAHGPSARWFMAATEFLRSILPTKDRT